MKQFLGMPQWFRVAARNFLVSGLVAYLACELAAWYFQPTYRTPVFLLMPLIWWVGFWLMSSSSRLVAGLTLRNIVTFTSNERHRHLVLKFRRRAIWARATGRLYVVAMLGTLVAMGWVFLFAGAILQGDAAYTLNASADRFEAALDLMAATDFSDTTSLGLTDEEFQALSRLRVELEGIQAGQAALPAAEPNATLEATLQKLDAFIASRESLTTMSSAVVQMHEALAEVRAVEDESASGVPHFLAVQGARFGGVAVLCGVLFVLARFYRYNIRLGAHFDARADVIELVQSDDIEKLVKGVEMFSPDAIDFGLPPQPVPSAPIGKILDVVGISRPS